MQFTKVFLSRMWRLAGSLCRDRSGVAAVEFAFLIPIVLAMFFGMVEITTEVAVNRKITKVARTLSDLTSQSAGVTSTDITNFQTTGKAVLYPYSPTPMTTTITQISISSTTPLVAKVSWSTNLVAHPLNSTVTIPSALQIAGTYLVLSEVSYVYVPAVAYFLAPSGVTLNSKSYTRPRQSSCVTYNGAAC